MPGNRVRSILGTHRRNLESFANGLLAPYLRQLGHTRVSLFPKEFNDAVWGTIVLQPLELVFIDSPLLQRLRRIRQLGVAHWVYPGATHTRLEHSLGVVHQVQNLVVAMNTRHPTKGGRYISEAEGKLLRLAGLLHDVGHGLMSHVSENALASERLCEDLSLEFGRKLDIESASLSEIAAYYMLGSAACKSLLSKAIELTGDSDLSNNDLSKVQRTIIGLSISDNVPLLHELISGPFDADKLDYMPRDASMCGVPVVTDIPRLIQKVRAVEVAQQELPSEVAKNAKQGLPSYIMTGVALSGGRTLDELMLGRTLLFDKIYRHHKSRAIETMVASVIFQIGELVASTCAMAPYAFTDDELINLDRGSIRARLAKEANRADKRKIQIAADLTSRLRARNLFVRSFAYAQNMPLDPYLNEPEQRSGMERFIRETQNPILRDSLRDEIAEGVKEIARRLHRVSRLPLDQSLRAYIAIDPPRTSSEVNQISRAYLISPDRRTTRFRDDYAESKGWADAYLLTRDIGYVFSASEISQLVYVATERIIRHKYGVRMPNTMLAYAKQDLKDISQLKRRLANSGYYAGLPYDIRPLPQRLDKADIVLRAGSLVNRLAGYQGPGSKEAKAALLNSERTVDWLRQFRRDDLIEAALQMLGEVKLIGREDIDSALRDFMTGSVEYRKGFICRFGAEKDSSSVVAYYAQDVARDCELTVGSVTDALSVEGAPIVFVDDFIGSGGQSKYILEHWLNVPHSVELNEDRGSSLSSDMRAVLRKRRLGFVFAAGTKSGARALSEKIAELRLNGKVHVQIDSSTLPKAFNCGLYGSGAKEAIFRRECLRVGKALLDDKKAGHSAKWVSERALGYGNDAFLVVFPYNTPSQTLTCLWKSGKVGDAQWLPLFPRREKV